MTDTTGKGVATVVDVAPPHHYYLEPASRTFPLSHREAMKSGSAVIEAEHMLLALASNPATPCGRMLLEAGLSHDNLKEALREEQRRSLAYAGVEPLSDEDSAPSGRERQVRLGASANLAIQRGTAIGHRRQAVRLGKDLLLGILEAEIGTVPRTLAIAGIDRVALTARIAADA